MHGVLGVRDTGNYMSIGDLVESLYSDFMVIKTFTVERPPLSWLFMRMIRGVDDLDKAVETAYIEGCKWFKLYDNVDEEIAREAVAKAHSRGLKITCHVTGFGVLKAIEYGFDAVEHLVSIAFTKPGLKFIETWESIDEGLIEEIAVKLREKNVAVSTTLALFRSVADKLRIDHRKYSKYIYRRGISI